MRPNRPRDEGVPGDREPVRKERNWRRMAQKNEARIRTHRGGKIRRKTVNLVSRSFHLVSHFVTTPVKRETKGHFMGALPMRSLSKTMKREGHLFHALDSREIALLSASFTFRFTHFRQPGGNRWLVLSPTPHAIPGEFIPRNAPWPLEMQYAKCEP